MEISCCIPCDISHFKHLHNALSSVENSTLKPDEICISISGIGNDLEIKEKIKYFKDQTNIPLNIVLFKEKKNAGENRNILAEISKGKILSYQDADDLIHKSRFKLIKYVFDSTDVLHINHAYTSYVNDAISLTNTEDIEYKDIKLLNLNVYYDSIFQNGYHSGLRTRDYGKFQNCSFPKIEAFIANGPVSIRREVVNKIKWKELRREIHIAEDQDFNYETLYQFNKSALILNSIYFYNLSDRRAGGLF
jgi:glycosyltransferase involved in cell wall biosynthesis